MEGGAFRYRERERPSDMIKEGEKRILCDVSHHTKRRNGCFMHGGAGYPATLPLVWPLDANVIGQHWASIRQL